MEEDKPISKKEFDLFRTYINERLTAIDIGLNASLAQNAINEFMIRRLSYYFTDVLKLFSPKDLHEFGKDMDILKTFDEEGKLFMEMFQLLHKNPQDVEAILKKDNENRFKLIEIKIKRTEFIIKRCKEKNLDKETIEVHEKELKNLREMKNSLYRKIDFTKELSELPDLIDYQKSEKDIDNYFQKNKSDFAKRLQKLPIFPQEVHIETRLSIIYSEIFQLCWLGLGGSAIVMMGVLLEAILKEIIFFREGREFSDIVGKDKSDFKRVIDYCKEKGYITEKEESMLNRFREDIRNKYQHHNVNSIATGISVAAKQIEIREGENIAEALKREIDSLKSGATEYRQIDQTELRSVGDLIKKEILDKNRAIPLFIQVHEFLIKKAKEHFNTK